ncbi:MAG TPA: DUF1415 domain-containing protein [Gemmatimonadales bacterium]|nr:DUF1415 domain-containing protein [Gemmatimonadales bacterium]
MQRSTISPDQIIAATRHWLEAAVIGLDLCPFARPVHAQDLIRYAVSPAETTEQLLADLLRELQILAEAEAAEIETTLLIHPGTLADFLDYNDFLDVAEAAIEDLGLDGVIQIASFHPQYQFAGTAPDDIENYTNRSPYPVLQLLREASVERAVAAFPDTARIFEKNIETLRRLGLDGWKRLNVTPR